VRTSGAWRFWAADRMSLPSVVVQRKGLEGCTRECEAMGSFMTSLLNNAATPQLSDGAHQSDAWISGCEARIGYASSEIEAISTGTP
jgi:hypothetical protein